MLLKRHIPLFIVIGVGLLSLLGNFINHPGIQNFVDKDALQWFDIIASFAIILGALKKVYLLAQHATLQEAKVITLRDILS